MGIQVISFRCTLKNTLGRVIGRTTNLGVVARASQTQILPGLAEGLRDLRTGENRRIFLRADQAYGFYDLSKVVSRLRDQISHGERLKIGDLVGLRGPEGELIPYRVLEDRGEVVVLDGNHPLAGQDLIFEIEATDARDATEDELAELGEAEGAPRLH
jgi:FKBP-type peptidyl-prolyl cis-trans isomerase SlyD